MFHHASPASRASILQIGLAARFDRTSDEPCKVFLATHPCEDNISDLWEANVDGLDLDEDLTDRDRAAFPGEWFCHYGDIGPGRLRLVAPARMAGAPGDAMPGPRPPPPQGHRSLRSSGEPRAELAPSADLELRDAGEKNS